MRLSHLGGITAGIFYRDVHTQGTDSLTTRYRRRAERRSV
jgi:hypothetical protein